MSSNPSENRTPLDLKIPPAVVGLVVASLQWVVTVSVPFLYIDVPMRSFFAAFLGILGMCIGIYGVIAFRLASTTVNPHAPQKTSSLVCTGLYARTRNPMYLGIALVLLGWAVYLSNGGAFALVPAFIAYLNTFQIKPEETHLRTLFPNEFNSYCERTRRWM